MRIGDVPVFPEQAGATAVQVDLVALAVLVVALLFAVPILVLLVLFVVRYRKGSPADRSNAPTGATLLELAWIAFPAFLGVMLFAYGAWTYHELKATPPGALEILVVGKQWMWKVQHASGRTEIDEIHVPAGRPVRLVMISEDVIHSFFLPELRVKQDVLPGRYSTMWFQADRPGEYHLFCAEYCGSEHASMRGRLVVMEPRDYGRWVAGGGQLPSLEERGRRIFEQVGCVSCHGPDSSVAAPRLEGAWGRPVRLEGGEVVRFDDDYLRRSIMRPLDQVVAGFPRLMPTYEGRLSEEQVLALMAYVRSMRSADPERRP